VSGVPPIRVLIADDHGVVREGLAAIIGRQGDMTVVAEAENGREAVDLWRLQRPDVTLLDLRMPVLDGVDAILEIRRVQASARIIVLTTFDTDNDITHAVGAGARGYLLKDVQRDVLLDCIRMVHAGQSCIPPALVAKLAESLGLAPLTARERDILALLVSGKSNREMGLQLSIGETTVKSHLRAIFGKFNVISRAEAIAVAVRRGLARV
jgi:DNA-binding NarL/FixJ family response regulator